jgi:hypothetical protein
MGTKLMGNGRETILSKICIMADVQENAILHFKLSVKHVPQLEFFTAEKTSLL